MRYNLREVDNLIHRLNESGIPFTRDVWVDEENALKDQDFGVVEIGGTVKQLWGDGQLIEQTIAGNVVLYVRDGEEGQVKRIQDILRKEDMSFFLSESGVYIESENKNRWTWHFEMEIYLTREDD